MARTDVIVLGAGIVGTSAALHLVKRGLAVALVDRSAEQVPEKDYSFKATPAVRTFGELIGHLANENFAICGAVTGDKAPAADYEKTTAKADLQKAFADSLAVCDKAFAAVNDQNAAETVTLFGRSNTKLGALSLNNGHLGGPAGFSYSQELLDAG